MATLSPDARSASSRVTKPRRVLACVLCQQRKVKCDRKFPCANCVKSRLECVPAALTQRQRKRRFPERELLERVRKYEGLLRHNNISFDALHDDGNQQQDQSSREKNEQSEDETSNGTRQEHSTPSEQTRSRGYKARNFWHSVSRGFRDADNESDSSEDDVRESTVRKAWENIRDDGNHLIFGTRGLCMDLSLSHPTPVQILRLWQVYLDNVNPLLKVTHIPTLQGRVIEAASNLTNIPPNLEALLFATYCIAVLSLDEIDCQTIVGSSKEETLSRYQNACQQALTNSNFLRTNDRDCLTALMLYLITVQHNTTPPAVSSLFGIAIRIAQRMGIHNEHALTKCTVLEAEMRRRLWWSLVLFDSRIGELSNTKPVTLDPSWDCKLPLNVNDADLREEMKTEPISSAYPTEAAFVVLRCEVGDFLRHAEFHLDFNCPGLKHVAITRTSGADSDYREAVKVEKMLEQKYFKFCDEENPIHFMTIWFTRSILGKCRLLEHHAKYSEASARQTESLRNTATSIAMKLLECDTKIMTSPKVRKFSWLNPFYFPFPAYIHIIQDLKRRPDSEVAQKAWDAMSGNYEPRLGSQFGMYTPFFTMLAKIVLEAWEATKSAHKRPEPLALPGIVASIKKVLDQNAPEASPEHPSTDIDMDLDNSPLPPLPPLDDQNFTLGMMGISANWTCMSPEIYGGMLGQMPMNPHMNWPPFNGRPGWQ